MAFELPPLPYAKDALEPYISKETLEYHYGKHHQTYVTNLNKLIDGTPEKDKSLEEIIMTADQGGIFNNAAQVWNHTFYWHSLSPNKQQPSGKLKEAIIATFGSINDFQEQFSTKAATNFGSGWTWLIKNQDHRLEIVNSSNAQCPLKDHKTPLLTCDVWEHAYYIDYRNARPKYLEAFWNIVNWEFVQQNFEK